MAVVAMDQTFMSTQSQRRVAHVAFNVMATPVIKQVVTVIRTTENTHITDTKAIYEPCFIVLPATKVILLRNICETLIRQIIRQVFAHVITRVLNRLGPQRGGSAVLVVFISYAGGRGRKRFGPIRNVTHAAGKHTTRTLGLVDTRAALKAAQVHPHAVGMENVAMDSRRHTQRNYARDTDRLQTGVHSLPTTHSRAGTASRIAKPSRPGAAQATAAGTEPGTASQGKRVIYTARRFLEAALMTA